MIFALTACNDEATKTETKSPPSAKSADSGELLTVDDVTNAFTDAGIVLENGHIPSFQELGATNALLFEQNGTEIVIYEYATVDEAIAAQERYPMAAIYTRNNNMLLNSEDENLVNIFLGVK